MITGFAATDDFAGAGAFVAMGAFVETVGLVATDGLATAAGFAALPTDALVEAAFAAPLFEPANLAEFFGITFLMFLEGLEDEDLTDEDLEDGDLEDGDLEDEALAGDFACFEDFNAF